MASSSSSPQTHLSLITTTTTVTPHPRRLPPPCWSLDETAALIDAYRDKWYSLRRGNLRATHWQEVADAVAGLCPVHPVKTPVQCRHKMEKLRKRYRNDVNRSLARPGNRPAQGPVSSWVHFNRMHAMEKGAVGNGNGIVMNVEEDEEEDNNDDDEELYQSIRQGGMNNGYVAKPGFKVKVAGESGRLGSYGSFGGGSTRVVRNGFREKFGNLDPSAGFGGASRVVGNGYDGKFANFDPSLGFGGVGRVVGNGYNEKFANFDPRVVGNGYKEKNASFGGDPRLGKRKRERDVDGVAEALRALGEGYVRVERMKMEMAREVEAMRMEMEMKRTEMILESQQRIVQAFASAVSENKKKNERMGSPES